MKRSLSKAEFRSQKSEAGRKEKSVKVVSALFILNSGFWVLSSAFPSDSCILYSAFMSKAAQLVQLLRSTKREKRLGTVILFVTSRCNAFCKTCFYHAELNRPGDMTFEQIEKVSRTMSSVT